MVLPRMQHGAGRGDFWVASHVCPAWPGRLSPASLLDNTAAPSLARPQAGSMNTTAAVALNNNNPNVRLREIYGALCQP